MLLQTRIGVAGMSMWTVPRGNTNIPTIMVAEKISAAIISEGVPSNPL
jgi:hypothetical protein